MMLAIIGYVVIIAMMLLILKSKALPVFCFAVLPVLGAFIAGFDLNEIVAFVTKGIGSTWKTAILFIFSVIYFGVMNDAGLFDKMVSKLLKTAGSSITMLMVATVLIATVGHLDGATASTYLISFPVMLPIFKQMKLRPLVLLLLVSSATGVMNLVPWGGPTIRAATAIQGDASQLWVSMIPMQVLGLILSIALAILFARIEKKRLASEGVDLSNLAVSLDSGTGEGAELKRPKLYYLNILLTVLLLFGLIQGSVPSYIIFMFGCVIALAINYPDIHMQQKRIQAHAPNCIVLTMTLLCAGVFLGIFAQSGMITEMAQVLIDLLPSFMLRYLHIIIGILGAPMGMIMGPDPYYYGVLPLVSQVVAPFGVTMTEVARAMLIGENVALAVSPCVPTTFLAIGLVGVELKDHIRFSFNVLWGISVAMLLFAIVTGIV